MKTSNYLIILFVVSFPCIAGEFITLQAPQAPAFDHYKLVQTWPFGYCSDSKSKCPSGLKQQFYIHGLWPVDARGATIEAQGPFFNISRLLQDRPLLKDEMDMYWRSLDTGSSNEEFWLHEYRKHGYASPQFKDKSKRLSYFKSTVDLYKKSKLLNALKAANITPDGSTIYLEASFDKAMKAKFGQNYTFLYNCVKKKKFDLLSEVILCVDGKAQNFTSCKDRKNVSKNKCPDKYKFPNRIYG